MSGYQTKLLHIIIYSALYYINIYILPNYLYSYALL